MLHRDPSDGSDRGMSIALTHVLTIGITTILVAMLLMAGSTMLDSEIERSTETALETVGERLAGDIDNVDRMAVAEGQNASTATLVSDQPRTVANSGYTVTVLSPHDCAGDRAPLLDGSNPCLELEASNTDVIVYVPVKVENEGDLETDQTVQGGAIRIEYDGKIKLTEANR